MADAGCIRGVAAVIERGGELLVIRRAAGIVAGGWWCFPGGAIEPGETPEQALVREIREEVGLAVVPVGYLWDWRRADGLVLQWWKARLDPIDQPLVLQSSEVAEARWVPFPELRRLHPVLESNLEFLTRYEQS